jgi:hypothetical protein
VESLLKIFVLLISILSSMGLSIFKREEVWNKVCNCVILRLGEDHIKLVITFVILRLGEDHKVCNNL